jgi:hypothetical protein
MLQYPDVDGEIHNWEDVTKQVHDLGGQVVVGTDLLALTMLKVREASVKSPFRKAAADDRPLGSLIV